MAEVKAKEGDTVRVHYTGKFTDHKVFDSSEGRDPLEFELGAGMVIPGFENALIGMEVSEEKKITFTAEEGYGPKRDDMVMVVKSDSIPGDIELELGMTLNMSSQDGQQAMAEVVKITDDEVTLDANHPLAGKDLIFEIQLVEIV